MVLTIGKSHVCTSGYIFDGDTLNMNYEGQQFRCRLQWIDCPESQKAGRTSEQPLILKHWELAEKAKTELFRMVDGKKIVVIPLEKDIYDRWICDLYADAVKVSANIQIALCKMGLAVPYFPQYRWKFSSRELAILRGIITETARADRAKSGIWSVPDFILPHSFKKITTF